MQFGCGTRILRVISRAGRPCHLSKLHQHPGSAWLATPRSRTISVCVQSSSFSLVLLVASNNLKVEL